MSWSWAYDLAFKALPFSLQFFLVIKRHVLVLPLKLILALKIYILSIQQQTYRCSLKMLHQWYIVQPAYIQNTSISSSEFWRIETCTNRAETEMIKVWERVLLNSSHCDLWFRKVQNFSPGAKWFISCTQFVIYIWTIKSILLFDVWQLAVWPAFANVFGV